MIVTANRQDIEVSQLKKKNHKRTQASFEGFTRLSTGKSSESSLFTGISPFMTVFLFSLCFFFFILGTEIPYKHTFYYGNLRNLSLPGETLLSQVEIKTLKAEAAVTLPYMADEKNMILWDVPNRKYRMTDSDRLSSLSQRYSISISTIISFNKLENIRHVREGDLLILPEIDGILYTVKKGDSLESLIKEYDLDRSLLVRYNPFIPLENGLLRVETDQELFLPQVSLDENEIRSKTGQLYVFPIKGRILKPFGEYRDSVTQIETFHNGIDILGNIGDPVKASFGGTVISAGFNNSYGNFIVLDHRNGYKSLYAHLSVISVQRNDKVLQGEMIGEVGKTGYAPTAHLHFSLFKEKKSVDPMDYLH
ncbi:LysM peptidoglycan-binding domain-containing protein [Oceanispirochaeta crateris]|uniref:LysM peptidoglycan-binding domain-containing protein n=1 Tax=Oceanispirochaeta crateris TaxID=2518645 RepID=A0A5C1QJ39_9SPIO|nr:M23 family metallopeptidase [Oceanispirochaeta crateris]QEN07169.1 LysM peptidoglycan-binding domain-containing protein [Oceanispirochaeta crateris]